MQVDKVKNMELSKMSFLGFAENEVRKATINNYITQNKEVREILSCLNTEFE